MSAEKLLKSISSYLKSTLSPGKVNQYIRLKVVQAYIEDIDEAIKLLAQPDHITDSRNMVEQGVADSKREPLSYSRTADLFHANKKATHPESYWIGVYDAEKAHGIGSDDA